LSAEISKGHFKRALGCQRLLMDIGSFLGPFVKMIALRNREAFNERMLSLYANFEPNHAARSNYPLG